MSPQDRSYAKVTEKLGKKAGYIRHIERWGTQFDWVDRAKVWDDFNIENTDDIKQKQIADQIHNELADLFDAREKWRDTFTKFHVRTLDQVSEIDDPRDADLKSQDRRKMRVVEVRTRVNEFKALVDTYNKINEGIRRALGLPTTISAASVDMTSKGEKIDNTIKFVWEDRGDNSGFGDMD